MLNRKMLAKFLPPLSFALMLVVTSGCVRAKIKDERFPIRPGSIAKSEVINVKRIDVDKAQFKGDKADDATRIAQEKRMLNQLLADQLIVDLKKRGFVGAKHFEQGSNGVLLEGTVTLFDHGSGAARYLVGMGAGSSNLHIDVKLTRDTETLADFTVVATSGGRGGIDAMGSFLEAHITDASEKITDYIMNKDKQ
jgi:hypothetical protein